MGDHDGGPLLIPRGRLRAQTVLASLRNCARSPPRRLRSCRDDRRRSIRARKRPAVGPRRVASLAVRGVASLAFHSIESGLHAWQRRVVRDGVSIHFAGKFRQLVEEFLRVLHHLGGNARVLQAHLHVVAADAPGEHNATLLARKLLEVDIPQPRDVVAVGLFVVDEEGDRLRRSVLLDDLEVLVEARGVLREVEQDASPLDGIALQTAVLRIEGLDGGLNRVVSAAHKVGRDAYREQVVHHVGTAECRANRPCRRSLARVRLRAGDVEGELALAKFHVLCREIERGAGEAARRAVPSSQLAVLAEIVFEHRRAQLAHRCVGDRVLRKAHALAHPERNLARPLAPGLLGGALGDGGAQGVVGVENEDGLR